jgi:DNA polymerase-3 subunit gamma/tau
MTYLALARKWRPRTFADVAGQSHVVRALENSLNSGRLHHAFLFTGTRGVGKTTIARIFVKALNCERGVSATPCGECQSCIAVDEGRFMDFIELDAASRTGVDDTRELLEGAQYTPAGGRFKVYLIDEVHMLSKSAFNALLKTLEEPPAHIKFLFATTDPQKIPVTVLSRCLQFNLKRLSPSVIAERLGSICEKEGVHADAAAIQRLARAASGSVRDGLSLLDQALAYGDGMVRDEDVAEMLGTLDSTRIMALLEGIVKGDAAGLMAMVAQLDELAPDYEDILSGLAAVLQQLAVAQLAGVGALQADDAAVVLARLADELSPETVQLLYQIAVTGRRDLHLAPDARTGFEMILLRLVAFRPGEPEADGLPAAAVHRKADAVRPVTAAASSSTATTAAPAKPGKPAAGDAAGSIGDWPTFCSSLELDGAVRQLAENSSLDAESPFELRLSVDRRNAHLLTDNLRGRLTTALQERLGGNLQVQIGIRAEVRDTAAARAARDGEEEIRRAREMIAADDNVQQMAALFGAEVVPESVQPASGPRRGKSQK